MTTKDYQAVKKAIRSLPDNMYDWKTQMALRVIEDAVKRMIPKRPQPVR